jgi:hypothetical protein
MSKNPESFVGKKMLLDIGRDVFVECEVKSVNFIFGRYDAEVKVVGVMPAEISVKFDNLIPIEEKKNG